MSSSLKAKFIKSAATLTQCPKDTVPEVAFVGRSNVGKSSTLNNLTGIRNLARVGKTPGRTQLINMFELEQIPGRLVDLPGYGYAKVSKTVKKSWGALVDGYLNYRKNLRGIVLVMDARHPPFAFDHQMMSWCGEHDLHLLILLNKADKLKRNRQHEALRKIAEIVQAKATTEFELFSATRNLGTESARERIRKWFEEVPS